MSHLPRRTKVGYNKWTLSHLCCVSRIPKDRQQDKNKNSTKHTINDVRKRNWNNGGLLTSGGLLGSTDGYTGGNGTSDGTGKGENV